MKRRDFISMLGIAAGSIIVPHRKIFLPALDERALTATDVLARVAAAAQVPVNYLYPEFQDHAADSFRYYLVGVQWSRYPQLNNSQPLSRDEMIISSDD